MAGTKDFSAQPSMTSTDTTIEVSSWGGDQISTLDKSNQPGSIMSISSTATPESSSATVSTANSEEVVEGGEEVISPANL